MASAPDIRQLTHAVVAAGNALLREANRLFKRHGISAVQFNVLNLLADEPEGLRPSDITGALVVDASSTTYVLDRMEALGWVQRIDHRDDRRAYRVVLTPAGRDLHGRIVPEYQAALKLTVQQVGARRIAPLIAELAEIQRAAHAAVDAVIVQRDPMPRRPQRRGASS